MDKLDCEWCKTVITDLIVQDGEIVYSLFWNRDLPGGSGIYRFRGRYFACARKESSFSGPYYSLGEAFNEGEIFFEWCKTMLPGFISEGKIDAVNEDDLDILEIIDLILLEGGSAYRSYWDSGGPGAGAGVESIYRFRGLYFSLSEVEGVAGPFQFLDDALAEEFLAVTTATVSIDCDELSAEDIARRLRVSFGEGCEEESHALTINGETWRARRAIKGGELEPMTSGC